MIYLYIENNILVFKTYHTEIHKIPQNWIIIKLKYLIQYISGLFLDRKKVV